MNPELDKLVTRIEMLENEKRQLIQTNASEIDVLAVEDEIEQTTLQYNTLLQLQEYQKFCNHVFIEDLIDITPDKSKTIEYCAHCFVGKKDTDRKEMDGACSMNNRRVFITNEK